MIVTNNVKPFILDPEQVIRQFAISYFHDSYNKDPELMPLVLESCRRYPENESKLRMIANSYEFVQSPETIREIEQYIKENPLDRDYYEQILTNCNLTLFQSSNISLNSLLPYTQRIIQQRLDINSRSTTQLWEDLLDHSASAANTNPETYDFNLGVIMVKELATRPDFSSDRVIGRLNFPFGENYKGFDEVYISMLAGELRLKQAIPLLLNKLASEEQLLSQSTKEALIKIGSEEVIQGLSTRFEAGNREININIAEVLGHIKLESAEKLALTFLQQELDKLNKNINNSEQEENSEQLQDETDAYSKLTVATVLAKSLCNLLSVDGIPLVMKLIENGYDPEITMLEENLYVLCKITGVNLPELDNYRKLIEEEKERYRQAKMASFLFLNKDAKIGRNDPCPCGSGKKYKKCCGK